MDSRRTVNDPKVRHVGFFAPPDSPPPLSPSLSPVMIPPPRHVSTDLPRHLPPPSHDTSNFSTPSPITESPSTDANSKPGVADGGANADVKPLKEKTTKAQRRAIQEAQRAAKGEGNRTAGLDSANAGKSVMPAPQRKDNSSVAASEKN